MAPTSTASTALAAAPTTPPIAPMRSVTRCVAGSRTPRIERRLASIQAARSTASGAGSTPPAGRRPV